MGWQKKPISFKVENFEHLLDYPLSLKKDALPVGVAFQVVNKEPVEVAMWSALEVKPQSVLQTNV